MSIWEVFVWMFWFYVVVSCLLILITAIVDVFRDPELNGWARALWVIFLVVLPVVGVIVYLIARGRSMSERGRALSQR
jgi:hypothetical protein